MLNEWQLQQAKGNFSQLIKRAANGDELAGSELGGRRPVSVGLAYDHPTTGNTRAGRRR